jgi:hypothetical protein
MLPITLLDLHVKTLAENLPRVCDALLHGDQYLCKDGIFRLYTTRSYRVARIYLGKQSFSFKLQELQYLINMFYVIQNQLTLYTLALQDVLTYSINALSSTVYIEPSPNACNNINYSQLFEELKTIM